MELQWGWACQTRKKKTCNENGCRQLSSWMWDVLWKMIRSQSLVETNAVTPKQVFPKIPSSPDFIKNFKKAQLSRRWNVCSSFLNWDSHVTRLCSFPTTSSNLHPQLKVLRQHVTLSPAWHTKFYSVYLTYLTLWPCAAAETKTGHGHVETNKFKMSD